MANGTTLRQVSPKKLPAGQGWGVLAGHDATSGEVVEVVTRKGKTWQATLTAEVVFGVWVTTETEATPGQTRERLERRADKREEWSQSRERKAGEAFAEADMSEAKTGIPFGQPILVGHHSERRHRKVIERADRKGFEGVEHMTMRNKHSTAAATINRNLERSIYDDDTDAVERLKANIAGLEARRERIKSLNKRIRKGEPLNGLELTEEEVKDLSFAAQYHGRNTFPPYVLQNLGGNITKTKQRLERLERLAS